MSEALLERDPVEPGKPDPAQRPLVMAILVVSLATVMAVIGQNVVNVGLPQMAADLGVSDASAVMIISAYQLALAVLVLPLAKLGERIGFRRVFLAGVAVFVVTSIGCALGRDMTLLVILRVFQGAGAAAAIGVTLAIYKLCYPAHLFARGLGIHAATVAISSMLGPVIAAAVLSFAQWPALFLVLAPMGALSLIVGFFVLPDNAAAGRFSISGALLFVLAWGVCLLTVLSIAHDDGLLVISIQVAATLGLGFLYFRREQREGDGAFLPPRLFESRLLRLSVITAVLNFLAQMTVLVVTPFMMRDVYGLGPANIALGMLAWPIGSVVAVFISELTAKSIPAIRLGAIGLALASVCVAVFGWVSPPLPIFVGLLFLSSVGFTAFYLPNNKTVMFAAPPDLMGAASGMLSAARLGGQTMGAALAAGCFQFGASTGTAVLIAAAVAGAATVTSLSLVRGEGAAQ